MWPAGRGPNRVGGIGADHEHINICRVDAGVFYRPFKGKPAHGDIGFILRAAILRSRMPVLSKIHWSRGFHHLFQVVICKDSFRNIRSRSNNSNVMHANPLPEF